MRHNLGILATMAYNMDTQTEECSRVMDVSEDIIIWLDMHDIRYTEDRQKIYICNNVEYLYLGPVIELPIYDNGFKA